MGAAGASTWMRRAVAAAGHGHRSRSPSLQIHACTELADSESHATPNAHAQAVVPAPAAAGGGESCDAPWAAALRASGLGRHVPAQRGESRAFYSRTRVPHIKKIVFLVSPCQHARPGFSVAWFSVSTPFPQHARP